MADENVSLPLPPGGGVCCIIGVCCPPSRAKAALADLLKNESGASSTIEVGKAASLIIDGYQLVPRTIEPGPGVAGPLDAGPEPARLRLEKLHRYVRAELRAILIDLGHQADKE